MHPEFIVSIDIGTTKIASVVGEYADGSLRIIGAASVPSSGIRKGMVVDMEEAAACVNEAVDRAERMAGVEIEGVCAGLSGPHVRSINSRGMISLGDGRHEVTPGDVRRVREAASGVILPADMEIIHSIPLDYTIDAQRGIKDPVGMRGSRLGVEVHLVTAQSSFVENMSAIFEKTGLDIVNTVFQPLACSYAVASRDEREAGCLVIDVGGGITDYALYRGGFVRSSGVVAAGGDNITRDLAIGLRIPESAAEEIKLRHGLALESLAGDDETVVLPGDEEDGGKEVRKKIIAAIIEPRCEEIFTMVKKGVSSEVGMGDMGGSVIVTGGGSRIMGMKSVASQVFDLPVRKGMAEGLSGLSEVVTGEGWSAGIGLLYFESERITKEGSGRGATGNIGWMIDRLRRIASLFL